MSNVFIMTELYKTPDAGQFQMLGPNTILARLNFDHAKHRSSNFTLLSCFGAYRRACTHANTHARTYRHASRQKRGVLKAGCCWCDSGRHSLRAGGHLPGAELL